MTHGHIDDICVALADRRRSKEFHVSLKGLDEPTPFPGGHGGGAAHP